MYKRQDEPVKGQVLPELHQLKDVEVFHAGTKFVEGGEGERYYGNGGRLILVSAAAASLQEAAEHLYEQLQTLSWPSCFYRNDIGWRAMKH